MITTIQLPVDVKKELDLLKDNPKMSYADVLKELIQKEKKRKELLLLKEYALKYGASAKKEMKEWESTEIDWE